MKKLYYCILNSKGDIIRHFESYDRAVNCLLDRWFDGAEHERIEKMTEKTFRLYKKIHRSYNRFFEEEEEEE